MAYIFISYSHDDKDYAYKLAKSLSERDLEPWIDDRIDYGTRWPQVIQEYLDGCGASIVVMTPRSYESVWVQNELSRAARKGKHVFPLLLKGEAWLSVETVQYVDVRDGRLPPQDFYDRLARVLGAVGRTDRREIAKYASRPVAPSRPVPRWDLGSVMFFLGVVSTVATRALLEAIFVLDDFREALANVWSIVIGVTFLVLTIGVTYWAKQRWWLWGCIMLLLGVGVSYGAFIAAPDELGFVYAVGSAWLAFAILVTYMAWRRGK